MMTKKKSSFVQRTKLDHREKGFTLIEAAIGLMVAGLIGTGIMYGLNAQRSSAGFKDTQGRIATVENAINQFYTYGNSRYPCPSAMNAQDGDANFGLESTKCDPPDLANMKLCTDPTWKTTDGYCTTSAVASTAVIIGAVPFNTLKINFEDSLDYWKNKVVYAVTFQKTSQGTFDSTNGTVRVMTMDDSTDPTADGIPQEKAFADAPDFMLISTGADGRGGFTMNGVELQPCGIAADGYESENCNFDDLFFSDKDPETANTGAKSMVPGATYFDDITRYQIKVPLTTWYESKTYPGKILTVAERIGVGTTSPTQSLDVNGGIKVAQQVNAKGFCDGTLANCFRPELLTGDEPDFKCGSPAWGDQALLRIATSKFFCDSPVDATTGLPLDGDTITLDTAEFQPVDCLASGKLMAGFSNIGQPICISP